MKHKIIPFLLFIVAKVAIFSIENSIIPVIENCEHPQLLNRKKYCAEQFSEICQILAKKEQRIRIATFNILGFQYDQKGLLENQWPNRVPRIAEVLNEMKPDILCVQEVYQGEQDQLSDLTQVLGERYTFYSMACDDGEMNGIFYRNDRFELLKQRVWFMTPPFDLTDATTLTMVQLKDKVNDKVFAVFNVHLSFSNPEKRAYQATYISKQLREYAKRMPVVLTGDMNLFPNRPDLGTLPFFDGDYIHRILTAKSLKDAREVALLGHVGPISSFTNAKEDAIPFTGTGTPGILLDRIYVSADVDVLIHAVQPATVGGHFPSDHMPLLIDCVLN